jgi:hypothetical protein
MSSGWWQHGEDGPVTEPPPDSVDSPPPVGETSPPPGAPVDDGWWGDAESEHEPGAAEESPGAAPGPAPPLPVLPPVVYSPVDPSDIDGAQPLQTDHGGAATTESVPATPSYPSLGPPSGSQAPTVQADAVRSTLGPPGASQLSLGPPTEVQPTLGPPDGAFAAHPDAVPVEQPPRPPLGRRAAVVGRFTASLLFLVGAAALLGWSVKSSLEADPTAVRLADEVAESANPAGVAPRTSLPPQDDIVDLPDVRGSKRDEALAILTEAGLESDLVKVKEVPWIPPAGEVVEQSPAPGTDDPELVELSIAKKATAPKVAGMKEDDAVNTVEGLGASAEITREFRAGTEAGIVLAQNPAEGAELTESVNLTIADAGVPVALSKIDTTDASYGCGSGSITVNSVDQEAEVACTVYPGDDAQKSEYVIAGQYGQFRARLVVASDSQLGQQARVTVSTESGEIANQTVGVGSDVPIEGPVTGAQRLIISISPTSADSSVSTDGVQVGLVEAELLTSQDIADKVGED